MFQSLLKNVKWPPLLQSILTPSWIRCPVSIIEWCWVCLLHRSHFYVAYICCIYYIYTYIVIWVDWSCKANHSCFQGSYPTVMFRCSLFDLQHLCHAGRSASASARRLHQFFRAIDLTFRKGKKIGWLFFCRIFQQRSINCTYPYMQYIYTHYMNKYHIIWI